MGRNVPKHSAKGVKKRRRVWGHLGGDEDGIHPCASPPNRAETSPGSLWQGHSGVTNVTSSRKERKKKWGRKKKYLSYFSDSCHPVR